VPSVQGDPKLGPQHLFPFLKLRCPSGKADARGHRRLCLCEQLTHRGSAHPDPEDVVHAEQGVSQKVAHTLELCM